jgi:hypothetical protein
MSERNTGLFLPGHVSPLEVAEVLSQAGDGSSGPGAVRVGHGTWKGRKFTHVGVEAFEVGGLLLMEAVALPPDEDPEMVLGLGLSAAHGLAVFLFYDEELGAGGHAIFRDGILKSRKVVDGRALDPMERDMEGERPVAELDPSEWIWPIAGDLVEEGAELVVGPGIRTDDDIEALIQEAGGEVAAVTQQVAMPSAQVRPQDPKRSSRLLGLFRRVRDR